MINIIECQGAVYGVGLHVCVHALQVEADFTVRAVVQNPNIVKIKSVSRLIYMIVNFRNTLLSNNIALMLSHPIFDLPASFAHVDTITITTIQPINNPRPVRDWSMVLQTANFRF